MKHVFISHSTADKELADEICLLLEKRGVNCWIAPRDIQPGRDYGEEIINGIESTIATVLVLSESSNESVPVMKEIERAVYYGKTVIPVRIRNVNPSKKLEFFVSTAQWIDAWDSPIDAKMDQLSQAIAVLAGGKPTPKSSKNTAPFGNKPLQEKNNTSNTMPTSLLRRFMGGSKNFKFVVLGFVLIVIIAIGINGEHEERDKEKARLEQIMVTVNELISKGNYPNALIQAAQLKWEASPNTNEGVVKAWDEKREAIVSQIQQVVNTKAGQETKVENQLTASTAQMVSLDEGSAAFKNKDYATALNKLIPLAQEGDAMAQKLLGLMYWQGLGVPKDQSRAEVLLKKAAEQGNSGAQFALGALYEDGAGVTKDLAKAVDWYQKAVAQGNSDAQFGLGRMYREGRGVPKDEAKAAELFLEAAQQGHSNAQNELGSFYEEGAGVPKDLAKAVDWYQKAAAQGNKHAQTNLCTIQPQHAECKR